MKPFLLCVAASAAIVSVPSHAIAQVDVHTNEDLQASADSVAESEVPAGNVEILVSATSRSAASALAQQSAADAMESMSKSLREAAKVIREASAKDASASAIEGTARAMKDASPRMFLQQERIQQELPPALEEVMDIIREDIPDFSNMSWWQSFSAAKTAARDLFEDLRTARSDLTSSIDDALTRFTVSIEEAGLPSPLVQGLAEFNPESNFPVVLPDIPFLGPLNPYIWQQEDVRQFIPGAQIPLFRPIRQWNIRPLFPWVAPTN
ncbi:hypothetical protein GNI_156610 [Gregarina niphandrodes]|uniref:Transmembrane protein n=1 Tax=Gregarina niphandrodes TaxID=110365 RepID=A0A023AZ32_GRENI|nr:hypothetical protein GNI_156610 [Gregarina niphandrodes]EZG43893.1 hypothetical protein GNI_156610 [Gregarina niphandrodes]|eukprot:XP_011132936.1 hypothetical protein GNI_156610 [Gregarina niphandrodes]